MSTALALSGLWPPFRAGVEYYLSACQQVGLPVALIQGYRSPLEQMRRYAQGRTPWEVQHRIRKLGANGAVTDAPPGESPHQYGLAVDISSPQLHEARALAAQIGFGLVSWDAPHLEWPGWRHLLGR